MRKLAILALLVLLPYAACPNLRARLVNARVILSEPGCGYTGIGVGDTVQAYAEVRSESQYQGLFRWWGGGLHYTSEDAPHLFRWEIKQTSGRADIDGKGRIIGREPGEVGVKVSSAGKSTWEYVAIHPRVTRFQLLSRDTSIRVGDSLTLRVDAGVTEGWENQHVQWLFPEGSPIPAWVVRPVEPDPDDHTERDGRELRVYANRAGTAWIRVCVVGNRTDSLLVRVTGGPRVFDRDVPPAIRVRPEEDTVVHMGEEFRFQGRVLNSYLHNGPYSGLITWGDGTSDTTSYGPGESYAPVTGEPGWGHDFLIPPHRYRRLGRHTVTLTVGDRAGRRTTLSRTVTVIGDSLRVVVQPDDSIKVVRLSDAKPFRIALVSPPGLRSVQSVYRSGWDDDPYYAHIPPLRIGRMTWQQDLEAGIRLELRDVNGDGDRELIVPIDPRSLVRSGDLRPGRNHILITGAIRQTQRVGDSAYYTPFRAIAVIDAVR